MSYSFIPKGEGAPYQEEPVIVFATGENTQKYRNIQANRHVSLLVHDWVAARGGRRGSIPSGEQNTPLSHILQSLNQTELSNLSATIAGEATVVTGPEAEFFRQKLRESSPPEAKCFVESANVVIVKLIAATVADIHNRVSTYE
jgi:hypothetical protein